ncbi:MAG: ABC transporter permease, partial [Pseudomonadota bacterium]
MLVVQLALRDLFRDRIGVICNVAIMAGVLVPLMLLFGVKNGVYQALIGRLLSNPATLQIDTSGNNTFTETELEEVREWPETGFATLKTRSLFDYVNIRSVAARTSREAILQPSGAGDPTLPDGVQLDLGSVVISAALASQLELSTGSEAMLVTQASERPRQLVLPVTVVGVVPADRMAGRSVLADIAILDLVEAFYDSYALPEHGITEGRPLSDRVATFEGIRAYARDLD